MSAETGRGRVGQLIVQYQVPRGPPDAEEGPATDGTWVRMAGLGFRV